MRDDFAYPGIEGDFQDLAVVFQIDTAGRLEPEIVRGAGFGDISKEFGAFLIYMVVALILFCAKFFSARRALLKHRAKEEKHRLQQLDQ